MRIENVKCLLVSMVMCYADKSDKSEASSFRRPTVFKFCWRPKETPASNCHDVNISSSWIQLIYNEKRIAQCQGEMNDEGKTFLCYFLLHFDEIYLKPVVISMAPLKLPMFQQLSAALSRQPNAAFCSCGVGCDMIRYVTHEHTCSKQKYY